MSLTSLSQADLLKLKNSIESSINSFNAKVIKLEENLHSVNDAIKHLDREKHYSISIPSKLLYTSIENSHKQKYEWKSKVERCIKLETNLIACRDIFNKLKMEDDWPLINDREAIKNISSALSYLIRDGKIKKIKIENNKTFLYGNTFLHFDINGNPKNKFDKKVLNNKIATVEQLL